MAAVGRFEDDVCFVATCSSCGETHVVGFDPADIDFTCGHIAIACDNKRIACDAIACVNRVGNDTTITTYQKATSIQQHEQENTALTLSERNQIFELYCLQPNGDAVHNFVSGEADKSACKIRYLNGEIVSHKGESFLEEDPWALSRRNPDFSGTSIGGIIGSHKLGRRGLGFKKRPKTEVDKIQLSRNQRVRVKQPAGCTFSGRGPHLVHAGFKLP